MAQRITRLTTDQKIAGSNPAWVEVAVFVKVKKEKFLKKVPPPGGLEPPTFRLTAERASRLRHGGPVVTNLGNSASTHLGLGKWVSETTFAVAVLSGF